MDQADWVELTNKIFEQWRNLLEEDEDTAYPAQWLGYYEKDEEDPVHVFQCKEGFTPECLQWHYATFPFPVQCYTMGTHSRCLIPWERPLGEIEGYFHKVKIIHTNRGPKKKGKKKELVSSMAN